MPWSGRAGSLVRDVDGVPVVSALHATPQNANLIVHAPQDIKDLLDTIDDLTVRLARYEQKRHLFAYTQEALEEASERNLAGESLVSIAKSFGCDRKTLSREMVKAGYSVADQAESQAARRKREKGREAAELTKEEALKLSRPELRS